MKVRTGNESVSVLSVFTFIPSYLVSKKVKDIKVKLLTECFNCGKTIKKEEAWIPCEDYHLKEHPKVYCPECGKFFNQAFHADLKSISPRYFERRRQK